MAISPIAKTFPFSIDLIRSCESTRIEPSFSRSSPLDLRSVVAGLTPAPRMTRSAGIVVPSLRTTKPTAEGEEGEGLKWERTAGR